MDEKLSEGQRLEYRRRNGLANLCDFFTQLSNRPDMSSEKVFTCVKNCLAWLDGTDIDAHTHFDEVMALTGLSHEKLGRAIAANFKVATADGFRPVQPGDAVPVPYAAPYIVPDVPTTAKVTVATSSPAHPAAPQPDHSAHPSF